MAYYMGDATSFNAFQTLTFLILITIPFILGDDCTAATSSSPVISPGPNSYSDPPFMLSTVGIVAALTTMFCLNIIFISLVYLSQCYSTHTNTSNVTTNSWPSQVRKNSGVDRDFLESLPAFRFGSLRGQNNGLDCPVCLARFEDPEVLRVLPKCKHAFHMECVDKWLDSHSTCPLCRYKVEPDDDVIFVKDDDNDTTRWCGT